MNPSKKESIKTNHPQIIDAKTKKLNALMTGFIGCGSFLVALLSSPIIFGHISAFEAGSLFGTFAVVFIVTALAYNFARGELRQDKHENKKSIYTGAIIAMIALVFMGFAQKKDIEANFSLNRTVSDIKSLAENIRYNESSQSYELSETIEANSDFGKITAKYYSQIQDLSNELDHNIDGLQLLTLENIENSSDLQDSEKIKQIRDDLTTARDLNDDFYRQFMKLILEMKIEINAMEQNDHSSSTQEIVRGFNEGYDKQSTSFKKLKQLSLNYYNSQISFLNFVIKNNNSINIVDDFITFDNDDGLKEYNDFLQEIIDSEETFNNYYTEFNKENSSNLENNINILSNL